MVLLSSLAGPAVRGRAWGLRGVHWLPFSSQEAHPISGMHQYLKPTSPVPTSLPSDPIAGHVQWTYCPSAGLCDETNPLLDAGDYPFLPTLSPIINGW